MGDTNFITLFFENNIALIQMPSMKVADQAGSTLFFT